MKIAVIVGTTRKQRVTPRVAKWVQNTISEVYPEAEVRLLDLAEYELPLLEEAPWTPNRVLTDGAKQWLSDLEWADGYAIATAEYNHSIPAVLKNALDYTYGQMKRKPAIIANHGVVHGARSAEHLKLVLNSTLGVVPVPNDVPFYGKVDELIDENGVLAKEGEQNAAKLTTAVKELGWYIGALNAAR